MSAFAKGTTVSPEKTRAEIETLVRRFGADGFVSGWQGEKAMVQFVCRNRRVRFLLALPALASFQWGPRRRMRKASEMKAAQDAETRRLWRSLLLVIKAKLEAVTSGVTTFESEFLAHILLPNGSTVGEQVAPQLDHAYASGEMPKLLGPGGGS